LGAAPRMPTVEAVDTFAEFLHIDPAGIEVVRESEPDQEHEPDIAFAGVVRHRPPTEDPWCSFEERRRPERRQPS